MAKGKKQNKKKKDYQIGYKKPPEEYKWKKGCKSPNPKGRPKQPKSLKEALQISLNKEINIKNEKGQIKKVTYLDAFVTRTLADAIAKDGPTRRLLFREDLLNLTSKEQEFEYETEPQEIDAKELQEVKELIEKYVKLSPEKRQIKQKYLRMMVLDELNRRYHPE